MGHHKIGACVEIGQNRIRGGWGVKITQKTSDIIYVRSLMSIVLIDFIWGVRIMPKFRRHSVYVFAKPILFLGLILYERFFEFLISIRFIQ